MDNRKNVRNDSDSDASSHPFYFVKSSRRKQTEDNVLDETHGRQSSDVRNQSTSDFRSLNAENLTIPSVFGTQLQDLVMRALVQTTASLVSSTGVGLPHVGDAFTSMAVVPVGAPAPGSTWNELAYRKAETRRNKKPDMMRTSAGENSDSESGFPLPRDATPEQRKLRTRRLNRWRAKKSRDLTSNRKAVKKLPFVIHVDGTCKPRGIHKRQWKAAVRGQCGRLDPSMDNINHHPKNVVDSMWHALEKEWEFEGFAHKAREMFEKSATKFMRNKKMQLKYKCQKSVDGKKPDDVSGTHWKKIVELTKKSKKQQAAGTSKHTALEEKVMNSEDGMDKTELSLDSESGSPEENDDVNSRKRKLVGEWKSQDEPVSDEIVQTRDWECESSKRTRNSTLLTGESVSSEEEDVDSQIRSLRSQLLWLEKSRKIHVSGPDDFNEVALHLTKEKGTVTEIRRVLEERKENIPSPVPCSEKKSSNFQRINGKATEKLVEADLRNAWTELTTVAEKENGLDGSLLKRVREMNEVQGEQMECGDIISMAAVIQGQEQDIGKGVLMGCAGSKFARKVIPKGWCSIKVSSCTPSGGFEACPIPCGWKDQGKHKTVKDAEGRIILWPDSLVHV